MKKSLIAALVASAAWVSVANAETVVYDKDGTSMFIDGRVMAVWYSAANSATNNGAEDSSIVNSGRFGIGASSPIGNTGFTAIGYMQWNVSDGDLHGDDGFTSRDQYVAIDGGKWGKLKVGKFQDSLVAVGGDATDIYETWGQTATALGSVERRQGQIQYSWSGYGVNVLIGYQAAKDQISHPALSKAENLSGDSNYQNRLFYEDDDSYKCDYADIESGFNFAITYTTPEVLFGPITVGAGYAWYAVQTDNYGVASGHNNNYYADDIQEWVASIRWGDLSVGPYVAVMYNSVTLGADHADEYWDDTTYQGVEIALGYSFDFGVHIYTGWQWQELDTDAGKLSAYDGESASVVPLFIGWQVNPQFDVWVEAIFAVDTDDNTETWATAMTDENAVGVGARYNF